MEDKDGCHMTAYFVSRWLQAQHFHGQSLTHHNWQPQCCRMGVQWGDFSGGQSCTLCLSSDHVRSSCALEPTKGTATQQNAESCHPHPYRTSDANGICHRFNQGTCQSSQCHHICNSCFTPGHNQLQCPRNKNRPTAADTKPK